MASAVARTRAQILVDVLLALGLLIVSLLELTAADGPGVRGALVLVPANIVCSALVLVRRRQPAWLLAASLIATVTLLLWCSSDALLYTVLALYSMAAHRRRVDAWRGFALACVVVAVYLVADSIGVVALSPADDDPAVRDWLTNNLTTLVVVAMMAAAVVLGSMVARRRRARNPAVIDGVTRPRREQRTA